MTDDAEGTYKRLGSRPVRDPAELQRGRVSRRDDSGDLQGSRRAEGFRSHGVYMSETLAELDFTNHRSRSSSVSRSRSRAVTSLLPLPLLVDVLEQRKSIDEVAETLCAEWAGIEP